MRNIDNLSDSDRKLRAVLMKCWEDEKEKEENDEAFQRIRGKRAARLRKQNSSKASTRVLPAELLSTIFLYACAEETFDRNNRCRVFLLASICSKWRTLVLGMTHLWSHLTMRVIRSRNPQENLELLQYYLDHVKQTPFALRLLFTRETGLLTLPVNRIFAIGDLLLKDRNKGKLETLRVEPFSLCFAPYLSQFQSICRLEIGGIPQFRHDFARTTYLANFAHLNRVELSSTGFSFDVQLPWTQITSLTLKSEHINVCVSLFNQCPNLREFHCFSPQKSRAFWNPRPQPDNSIFDALENFTWTFDPDPVCTTFFSRLRLPSLRSLQWYSRSYRRPVISSDESSGLHNLFASSTFTLSRLQLYNAGSWPVDLIKNILSHAWNLRTLHLTKCSYKFAIDTLAVLKHSDGGLLLPLLDKLIIQDPEGSIHASERERQETQLASHIVPLFRNRDPSKKKSFSLQLSQTAGLQSKDMRKVYSALRFEGYAFNIWVDSAMTCSIEEVLERERRRKSLKNLPKVPESHRYTSQTEKDQDWDDEPRLAYSVD